MFYTMMTDCYKISAILWAIYNQALRLFVYETVADHMDHLCTGGFWLPSEAFCLDESTANESGTLVKLAIIGMMTGFTLLPRLCPTCGEINQFC